MNKPVTLTMGVVLSTLCHGCDVLCKVILKLLTVSYKWTQNVDFFTSEV